MEKEGQPIYLYGVLKETLKTCVMSALFAVVILLFVSFYVNYILLYYVGGTLLLTFALAPAVAKWRPKKRISVDGKAVFISGCDRGFGHMLAQRLDDIGFHVFAGCLFPDGPGAKRLQESASKRLHIVGLDVTSDSSVEKAATYVEENLGHNVLWGVVNNAGIVEPAELSLISMKSIQKTFDVNTFGVLRLTKAFLLKLKESKGRVVSVASIAGRYSFPHLVPYCMTKKAVIGFSDGLRLEMYKWNIQVITIEPALFRTPMTNEEEISENLRRVWAEAPHNLKDIYGSEYNDKSLKMFFGLMKYFFSHPREVVSVMEEALTALHPEYYYTPGSFIMRFACWIAKRLPKPVADIVIFHLTQNEV